MTPLAREIDGSVAVIGDVHGQVTELADILDQLRGSPDFESRWVVFIGDLVDRGPDPKGAIDLLLEFRDEHPRTTAVAGNHEFAMAATLGFLPRADCEVWEQRWCDHYGAESTFSSYGAEYGDVASLKSNMPESHQEFLTTLPWSVEHPHYFFVHAGLSPLKSFQMQRDSLRMPEEMFDHPRPENLCSKTFVEKGVPDDCPLTVVSGHVPFPEVRVGDRRILVDTTGGEQGDLSCVLLSAENIEYIITSGDDPAPPTRPLKPARQKKRRFFGLMR